VVVVVAAVVITGVPVGKAIRSTDKKARDRVAAVHDAGGWVCIGRR
jgi:hypothetical protein